MKQQSTQEIYHYWNLLRGRRAAPERSDMDPGSIRKALPDVFLLEFKPNSEPSFRLAGTRVCSLFGRELMGETFTSLFAEREQIEISRLIESVCHDEKPMISGVVAKMDKNTGYVFEMLLLPLRHRGVRGQRLLGVLAAAEDMPIFLPAAQSLSMITLKMLDTNDLKHLKKTPSFQTGIAADLIVARKAHLVLIDGSRG